MNAVRLLVILLLCCAVAAHAEEKEKKAVHLSVDPSAPKVEAGKPNLPHMADVYARLAAATSKVNAPSVRDGTLQYTKKEKMAKDGQDKNAKKEAEKAHKEEEARRQARLSEARKYRARHSGNAAPRSGQVYTDRGVGGYTSSSRGSSNGGRSGSSSSGGYSTRATVIEMK